MPTGFKACRLMTKVLIIHIPVSGSQLGGTDLHSRVSDVQGVAYILASGQVQLKQLLQPLSLHRQQKVSAFRDAAHLAIQFIRHISQHSRTVQQYIIQHVDVVQGVACGLSCSCYQVAMESREDFLPRISQVKQASCKSK